MNRVRQPLRLGLATLIVGLALSAAAALWQYQRNLTEADRQFGLLAKRVSADLVGRMQTYEYGLRGARGVVLTADRLEVSPARFRLYSASRELAREFPGARGFGIIVRVPQADEARFVQAAREHGRTDFSVRQLAAHAGERYVIDVVEPIATNRAAIGLDIASETNRRTAAEVSMRTGKATLTGPITLVQASGHAQRSFLLMIPVYRPGLPLNTPDERQIATVAWSYAPLVIDEVLRQLESDQQNYTLSLRDRDGADTQNFYTQASTLANGAANLPGPTRRVQMDVFGRRWEADLRGTPAFLHSLDLTPPAYVAALGALLAALCATLVTVLARLSLRTHGERMEQARRAAIVDSSEDAILVQDLSGQVTDWNAGAVRLFGYSAHEARGRGLEELLLPVHRRHEDSALRDALRQKGRCAAFETTRQHRDGTLIDVSITAAALLNSAGECVGFTKTLRDTRAARQHERELTTLNANLEVQVLERTAKLDAALHDQRAILDAVPSLIAYWDCNLVNRMANQAYGEWFKQDPATMQGKTMLEVIGPDLMEKNRPYVEAALRGEARHFERDIPRLDGQGVRHALAHYQPDVVDGEVRGFFVLVHDVSELVQSRLALAAAQRDNAALLGTIQQHAIVSVTDRRGTLLEANDAFCAISGYPRDELLGQNHRILNARHHDPAFWIAMWCSLASGQAWRGEICNRRRDGSLYWVDSIIAPFVGADGQIEKYISIGNDITGAKAAEAQLRASEALLERAGGLAGVGGWELDLRQSTLQWSSQTHLIHEVAPDFVPSLATALDFYAPSGRPRIEAAVAACVQDGTPWDLELPLITAKGRHIWVRAVGTAEFEAGRAVRLVGAFQDITERKQAAANLAYERQLMTSLMDTLPDQIYFKDVNHRFLRINPALARRYGLSDPAQAIGKSDADFFTAGHARQTAAIERNIMVERRAKVDLEEQEFWPDRPPTWNLTTKMPLYDDQGRIMGTFGLSRDITARRQTEEALTALNQRFKVAADSVGMGVWEYDILAGTLHWDQRMYTLYGLPYSADWADYALWRDHMHPDDRVRSEAELNDAIAGRRPFETTFRIVLPRTNEVKHLRAAAHVQRDAQGQAWRMTGVSFDVTARVRAEATLRDTMTLLNAVLDSATQASIIAVKPDGLISVFNAGAQHMLGYHRDEVVDHQTALHFHLAPELKQRAEQLSLDLGRKVHTGQVLIEPTQLGKPEQWSYVRKDGSTLPVSLAVTAMRDDNNALFGYLGIAHDISQQKEQERQLREAIHKANAANQAKSQFLANMSHEIRTPMNAVIGLSYLLEHTALDADQASTLSKISLASKSLLAIINDVLDLSKIEAGEMQMEHAPFGLRRLLEELAGLLAMQAHDKGISFELDMADAVPAAVTGDATRLGQVLSNLVSNAIKFTHVGAVTLKVRVEGPQGDKLRLRFTVQDSGIGIAADALDKIFTPFAQEDTSTTRRFGGTGLGLSIVKQLVTLMGGEIGLSSQLGEGSEFWVVMDYRVSEDALAPSASPSRPSSGPGLSGLRVLVADDNHINLEVARRVLELEGARVQVVHNGQEAVDLLAAQPDAVDLVLMDVQMPVMDGLDATRRIRGQLGMADLPIIALTAGITKDEHQRISRAGMNDIVAKPFTPHDLVVRIRRHVTLTPGAEQGPASAAPPPRIEGWPEIPGIDMVDAALRLGGDLALFHAMLRRLLRDCADLPDQGTDPAALQGLSARLHNLKGSAGTLGAKSIENLAAQAELACLNGRPEQAGATLRPLVQALKTLRQDAGPILQRALAQASQALAPSAESVDEAALAELVSLLRSSDLGALTRFAQLAPGLQLRLSAVDFAALSEQMENLQFEDAAQGLAKLG